MRYNYKYAMPMDPRVLKKDFESEGVDTIPGLVSLLKSIRTPEEYIPHHEPIRNKIYNLWFNVNIGRGINLRDREKLLPVFQQLSRIFKKTEKLSGKIYRGVTLPSIYKNILSETFPDALEGDIVNINSQQEQKKGILDFLKTSRPEVKEVLENLAYGLRSWTKDYDVSSAWAVDPYRKKKEDHDSILFISGTHNAVFDCNSFFEVMGYHTQIKPFDPAEVICLVEKPRITRVKKVLDKTIESALWWVEVV